MFSFSHNSPFTNDNEGDLISIAYVETEAKSIQNNLPLNFSKHFTEVPCNSKINSTEKNSI